MRYDPPRLLAIAPTLGLILGSCSSVAPWLTASQSAATPAAIPPPLIEATLAGDPSTVEQLLQAGAEPNQVYHTNTALTYAARDGFTQIAVLLLAAGADVNWIDGEGVTPLILASFKGHRELVQLLLDHGADTTIIDQWDRTALDYALRRGDEDAIAQMLHQAAQGP